MVAGGGDASGDTTGNDDVEGIGCVAVGPE